MKKVLIFQDLAPHVPFLTHFLKSKGFVCLFFVDGEDLSKRLDDSVVVVLSNFKIKKKPSDHFYDDLSVSNPEVLFFVHANQSQLNASLHGHVNWESNLNNFEVIVIEKLAKKLEFTLEEFKFFTNEKVRQKSLQSKALVNRSRRHEIKIRGRLILNDSEVDAYIVNISLSGVLLLINDEGVTPTGKFVLSFEPKGTSDRFLLNSEFVRFHELKQPIEGYTHALAARFIKNTPEQESLFQEFIDLCNEKSEQLLKKEDLSFVIESLQKDWKVLIKDVFDAQKRDPRFRCVGDISKFELNCVKDRKSYSAAVIEGIVLRAKLGLLTDITMYISQSVNVEEESTYWTLYCEQLRICLDQLSDLESKIEDQVKEAVQNDDLNLQQKLNKTSNQLHDLKIELYQKMDASFKEEVWHDRIENFSEIQSAVIAYRQARGLSEGNVKFSRRRKIEEEKKKNVPKVERDIEKVVKKKQLRNFIFAFSSLVFIVGFQFLYSYIASRLSAEDLSFDFETVSIQKSEDGVEVVMQRRVWDSFGDERKESVFKSSEDFVRDQRLFQIKFVDLEGRNIAASAFIRLKNDGTAVFSRREFGAKGR